MSTAQYFTVIRCCQGCPKNNGTTRHMRLTCNYYNSLFPCKKNTHHYKATTHLPRRPLTLATANYLTVTGMAREGAPNEGSGEDGRISSSACRGRRFSLHYFLLMCLSFTLLYSGICTELSGWARCGAVGNFYIVRRREGGGEEKFRGRFFLPRPVFLVAFRAGRGDVTGTVRGKRASSPPVPSSGSSRWCGRSPCRPPA